MELVIARQILRMLTQGIHPVTGESMPADSPYNSPPVIRALHAIERVIDSLDAMPVLRPPKVDTAVNARKEWTKNEEAALATAFQAGIAVDQVAKELGRSTYSIEQRLVKLGLVHPLHQQRRGGRA